MAINTNLPDSGIPLGYISEDGETIFNGRQVYRLIGGDYIRDDYIEDAAEGSINTDISDAIMDGSGSLFVSQFWINSESGQTRHTTLFEYQDQEYISRINLTTIGFGSTAAISRDGGTFTILGRFSEGEENKLIIYNKVDNEWIKSPDLIVSYESLGSVGGYARRMSISDNGNTIMIHVVNFQDQYRFGYIVFKYLDGEWVQYYSDVINNETTSRTGNPPLSSISGDGNILAFSYSTTFPSYSNVFEAYRFFDGKYRKIGSSISGGGTYGITQLNLNYTGNRVLIVFDRQGFGPSVGPEYIFKDYDWVRGSLIILEGQRMYANSDHSIVLSTRNTSVGPYFTQRADLDQELITLFDLIENMKAEEILAKFKEIQDASESGTLNLEEANDTLTDLYNEL